MTSFFPAMYVDALPPGSFELTRTISSRLNLKLIVNT